MVKSSFIFIILFALTACSTVEKKKLPPPSGPATSIEHLDEAANFLALVGDDEASLKERCNISPSEALNLLQPLHAMIDEEMPKFIDKFDENHLMNCANDCHCGLYSDLTSNQDRKETLFDEAKEIKLKEKVACASKSAKWLCSSKLLLKLKSESEPAANGL
jgi:hypothetical protein